MQRNAATSGLVNAPALMATVALTEALFGLEQEARSLVKTAIALGELLHRYPTDTLLTRAWSPAVSAAIALDRADARGVVDAVPAPPNAGGTIAWPPYLRGWAHLRLKRPADAADEFRTVLGCKGSLLTSSIL